MGAAPGRGDLRPPVARLRRRHRGGARGPVAHPGARLRRPGRPGRVVRRERHRRGRRQAARCAAARGAAAGMVALSAACDDAVLVAGRRHRRADRRPPGGARHPHRGGRLPVLDRPAAGVLRRGLRRGAEALRGLRLRQADEGRRQEPARAGDDAGRYPLCAGGDRRTAGRAAVPLAGDRGRSGCQDGGLGRLPRAGRCRHGAGDDRLPLPPAGGERVPCGAAPGRSRPARVLARGRGVLPEARLRHGPGGAAGDLRRVRGQAHRGTPHRHRPGRRRRRGDRGRGLAAARRRGGARAGGSRCRAAPARRDPGHRARAPLSTTAGRRCSPTRRATRCTPRHPRTSPSSRPRRCIERGGGGLSAPSARR